jgi:glutamate-1-semialdehyde 2,1-aminomutase
MIAICTAMRYTGRSKIVVFQGGYHGSLLSHFRVDDPHADAGPSSAAAQALTAPFVRNDSRKGLPTDGAGFCRLPVQ